LINDYLKQNQKGDAVALFQEMDQDNNERVDMKEFTRYFMRLKE